MADLSSIPVPLFTGDQPYHYTYDNLPIDALIQRDQLINLELETNSAILSAAGGDYDLATRLNQSLDNLGNLKSAAVNISLHNIGSHSDGSYTVSSEFLTTLQNYYPDKTIVNPVPFVRMLEVERVKLATLDDNANFFGIQFNLPSNLITFNQNYMVLSNSSSVRWVIEDGQKVKAEVTTALNNPHRHFDNVVPTSKNLVPNYKDYSVNGGAAYTTGSLKVFINGIRIFNSTYPVNVPQADPAKTWKSNYFTESEDRLGFSLFQSITEYDIIMVDFTVPLT
jgi:hypothetical protein